MTIKFFADMGKKNVSLNAHCMVNTKGELLLYGMIGDWWDGLDASTIVSEVAAYSGDEIHVRIHSEGGYIMDGLAMYNALKQAPQKIIVHIDGMAYSMAGAVAMAGDERHIPSNAIIHIHRAHGPAYGDVEGIKDAAEALAVYERSYVQILSDGSGKTLEEIDAIIADRKDHFYQGQAAVDMGLATHLIAQPVQAAAHLNTINLPQEYSASLYAPVSQPNLKPKPKAAASAQSKRKFPMFKLTAGRAHAAMCIALAALLAEKFESVDKAVAALTIEADILTGEKSASDTQIRALAQALGLIEKEQAAPSANAEESINKKDLVALKKIAAQAKLEDSVVEEWIEKGTSVLDARAQAFDALAQRSADQLPAGAHVRTVAAQVPIKTALAQAMLVQGRPGAYESSEDSNEFRAMSLMEMAKASLEYAGERTKGKTQNHILAMAFNTTSDFPYVVEDVANKEMLRKYRLKPATFKQIARQASASDFKARNVVALGAGSELEKLNQSGEIKRGKITEAKNSYKLDTYAKMFSFGRQLMINDDLGALLDFMGSVGTKAAQLESKVFWDLVKGTPKYNGQNLFDTSKNTEIEGTAELDAALVLMQLAIRTQVGLDNEDLDLSTAFLVVSPEREIAARKILSAIEASKTTDVNVFSNSMRLIIENRLAGETNNPFYTFASADEAPVFEYCYLRGNELPYVEIEQVFGTRGMNLAIAHDFAAGVVGPRGVVKNPGYGS